MPVRVVGALTSLWLLVLVGGGSAWADGPQDGLWWFEAMGVPEVHTQGATGAGVTIAVIDGGINTAVPTLEGADIRVHEPSFCAPQDTPGEYLPAEYPEYDDDSAHGTNVVSMLVGNGRGYHGEVGTSGIAPDASILFYALRVDHACGEQVPGGGLADLMAAAIVQAVDDGADIISISVGGGNDTDLADARAYAISRGVVIVQSMNNEFTREALPVSRITDPLNGVVLVQAVGPDREPATEGARSAGEGVTVMAPGAQILLVGDRDTQVWETWRISGGSSFATPLVAGMLADTWSVYPEATGNQLLQSLIRNTGSEEHELTYHSLYGYGLASVHRMVQVDPTQYPDVNPLIEADGYNEFDYTAQEIAEAERPSWAPPLVQDAGAGEPVATATPSAGSGVPPVVAEPEGAGVATGVWIGAGAGVVAVLVVAAVLIARAQSRTTTTPHPQPGAEQPVRWAHGPNGAAGPTMPQGHSLETDRP
ncbi:S8 family peptidase [Cellulomonas denverensis]|uniref:S8 family peptidase n=1 Tax=Cellulomonas denverensis TaxID=264297 RepID=UPI0035EAD2E5